MQSLSLESRSNDRDNNFNLIRLGAALAVILSHSILLSGNRDSGFAWALGYFAVNCFFVVSGFLVCASLLRHNNLPGYLLARVLRIYPALIAAVLACVFILGLNLTATQWSVFLGHSQTINFLLRNSLLVVGTVEVHLPGLFSTNPFPGQVNAPLWTLQYEIAMYGLLALLWFGLRLVPGANRLKVFTALSIAILSVTMFAYLYNITGDNPKLGMLANGIRFAAMFFSGVVFYLLRHRIRLWSPLALFLCGVILIASLDRPSFIVATYLSLGYLLLYLAYIPGGWIRAYNKLGDYSYGLYIFAFPIQQLLVWTWPDIGAVKLFFAAMSFTLPLAIASWHWLERPALGLKSRMTNYKSVTQAPL